MLTLSGKHIRLRALEPEDLDFLYELENNTDLWEISGTLVPYSRQVLKLYLENAHRDIFEVKQLRLCITDSEGRRLGLIDLFDYDPKHRRAGLGVVISREGDRNKGYGKEAIELLCNYAFHALGLHQIYINVREDNKASIKLFEKLLFTKVGVKRDWLLSAGEFKNELMMQKIKP